MTKVLDIAVFFDALDDASVAGLSELGDDGERDQGA
jgi:hypothetical protein